MTTALITGVNGQDGSYLAELLLAKDYHVVGTVRDSGAPLDRVEHLRGRLEIVQLDLANAEAIDSVIRHQRPKEFYNLAARASSAELWHDPVNMCEVNGLAIARMLEAIRTFSPQTRFCNASSSEIFGNPVEVPQSEATPLCPRNPYGAAKAYAQWVTAQYREQYRLFACSAILFNHESPRRGCEFVTRKVSRAAARISRGLEHELRLGDLDVRRDWGFAGDYVQALWMMLQQPRPDDYVLATGATHSVREFCEFAFSCVNLDYRKYVVQDKDKFRSRDTAQLVGNPEKAKRLLGWTPSVFFEELVRMMVEAELRALNVDSSGKSMASKTQSSR